MSFEPRKTELLGKIAENLGNLTAAQGFGLGPAVNTFGTAATADQATAEGLRDAYQAANPHWHAEYIAHPLFMILVQWSGDSLFQRWSVSEGAWHNVSGIIQGEKGDKGDKGDMGDMGLPGEGLPTYIPSYAYSPADDRINFTIPDLNVIPQSFIIITFVPSGIDRKFEPLDVAINGNVIGDLKTFVGTGVAARDLTPSQMITLVRPGRSPSVPHLFFTIPLPQRPQDFTLVCVVVIGRRVQTDTRARYFDGHLSQADVDNAGTMLSSSMTEEINIPPFATTRLTATFYLFGVPETAPDIEVIGSFGGRFAAGWRDMVAGGTGAAATATVVGGVVTSVTVTNGGSGGYGGNGVNGDLPPRAVLEGAGGSGAVFGCNLVQSTTEPFGDPDFFTLGSVDVLEGGSGYTDGDHELTIIPWTPPTYNGTPYKWRQVRTFTTAPSGSPYVMTYAPYEPLP